MNMDPYNLLAFRIKSDGRKYFVNLQTDSIEPTDLHQHRVYAKRPGEWETITLSFWDFVRTNNGLISEPQSDIMKDKLATVGFSLVDRHEGPFDLKIEKIWATN